MGEGCLPVIALLELQDHHDHMVDVQDTPVLHELADG